MTSLVDELAKVAALNDLTEEHLTQLAAWGTRRSFDAGASILVADGPANEFHVVVSGRVAVVLPSPNQGPLLIETVGPSGLVGVSWLLPPFRWTFAARAVEPTRTIALDADAIRTHCDGRPEFGYQLFKGFAAVIHDRMVSARVRLLDLYTTSSVGGT
jgi:CRP-like cAMP-binding protein